MVQQKAIIVGAGIAGLAMARALARKNFSVKVFDRSSRAVGASVRNFGMIWPIGQGDQNYGIACRSRDIWKELSAAKVIALQQPGSMHVAHHADEWQVLNEIHEKYSNTRPYSICSPEQVKELSAAALEKTLIGGLYSSDECIVDPVDAISSIATYLQENSAVEFYWNTSVNVVQPNRVITGEGKEHNADIVVVCSGADLETLFPEIYKSLPFTRCKLQMMRFISQENWNIGAALCGGLSLIHYKSFAVADSLLKLKKRYEEELPSYIKWGIHVMVSQNSRGELTVGDSHEYGDTFDPFDRNEINDLILSYLDSFARFRNPLITQTWNGIYSKITDGSYYMFREHEKGVYLFNGLGGNGMTLSFGLAEQLVGNI